MTITHLAPVKYKQGDFFISEIFDNLPFKDDMAGMEYPLFTLSRKPDMRILRYEKDKKSIEMQPSAFGLPSIMDKDVLLYCASIVMEKINRGEYPPKTIRLSLHDLLIAVGRVPNGKGYDIIKRSLNRLAGCLLKTSIKTGRTEQGEAFHLLESYKYLESVKVKNRIIGVEVTLSDWFYNSLIAKEVLTINPAYFKITSPLARRIYEIARKHEKHMKEAGSWSVSLENLYEKTGSASLLRIFKQAIKKLCENNSIPDYGLFLDAKNIVHFRLEKPYGEIIEAEEEEAEHQYVLMLEQELTHALSEADIAKAKKAAGRADIYGLWADFRQYNMDNQNKLDNVTAAFIGWCKLKKI